MNTKTPKRGRIGADTFQIVRIVSWSFFVLLLGFNLFVSLFIADNARRTLIEKQESYALLLAENLNHQIFQRFTLPTLIGFKRIELANEAQYNHLDQVVKSTIHSFHVQEVRIYDYDQRVSYSTEQDLVGLEGMAGEMVSKGMEETVRHFEVESRYTSMQALIAPEMEPESVILKTVFTLHAERQHPVEGPRGPIMGVLEFTQDITDDYRTVIHFQRLIFTVTFVSSLTLFFIMLMILRRADRILAQRTQQMVQLEKELHVNEKMASMGRVVSSIAHEIRNPLGIIRSSSELLLNKAKAENSPHSKILQAIFDESKRLSRTVTDFLDYARPQKPRRDEVDLAFVLSQAVTFLEPACKEHGVDVHRRIEEGLVIPGDKDLLYRAFYNLLVNALEAIAEQDGRGVIEIVARREEDDSILLSVADSGPGFDDEILSQVSDPFFTTKDTGTGLGLAIVDTILSSHGAEMTIGNGEYGGAKITVVFPPDIHQNEPI